MLVNRRIEEVKYFLNKMEEYEHSSEEMIYNLDAFLVMAKSITEILGKQRGNNLKKWYDEITPKFQLLNYFKDKRDFVIHEGYLDLSSKTEIKHTEHITVGLSITIDVYKVDKDGNGFDEDISSRGNCYSDENHKKNEEIILSEDIESNQPQIKDENMPTGTSVKRFYYFEEFPDKSVVELCNQYFDELVEINRIYGKG